MSEIYRDPSEGAKARREDLLRHRRDELAEMPHVLRRVVVARAARIGAATAAIAVGGALVGLALVPGTAAAISHALPGKPAVLTALLAIAWGAAAFGWWVARARVEHRYALAMSRLVQRSANLDLDLQRLDHERPDDFARGMALRMERRAIALPVLAAALVMPATAVYLFALASARTWPQLAHVEDRLGAHAGAFVAIAAVGAVGALVATTIARRRQVAIIVGGVAIVCGFFAVPAAFDGPGALAWLLVAAGVVGSAIAWGARGLDLERAAIRVDGAVPLRELTLKDVACAVRRGATHAVRAMGRHRHATMLALCGLGVAFGAWHVEHRTVRDPQPQQAPRPAWTAPTPVVAPVASADVARVTRQANGQKRIEIAGLTNALWGHADAEPIADLPTIPDGWQLTYEVSTDAPDGVLEITAFDLAGGNDTHVDPGVPRQLTASACNGATIPTTLHIAGYSTPGFSVWVLPTLRLANCSTK